MWLPKCERECLKYFFDNATYGEDGEFEYSPFPNEEENLKIERFVALKRLMERKLLVTDDEDSEYPELINYMFGQKYKLTLIGWDLANKYNHRIRRWGLFFNEYRDCGLGFFMGLIGGLIAEIIFKILF